MVYLKPDEDQIEYWIHTAYRTIQRSEDGVKSGFYEQEGISTQAVNAGFGLRYQGLARALFFRGDPIIEVRAAFSRAGEYQIRNFSIAYDDQDPEYAGAERDLSVVIETEFIDGMNSLLMACNLERAKHLASLYQTSPDGYMLDISINRFCHSLKYTTLDQLDKAREYRDLQFADYQKKLSKKPADVNYSTRFSTLSALLDNDEVAFNEGLLKMAKFYYEHEATKECKNTDEEYICDHCVALANLGLYHGLNVTVQHHLIPKELLLR